MALPKAGVELIAEGLSQFLSGMGKAEDAVDTFGKSGASSGKAFSSGFGDIVTGALRKVGELGVEALLKAGKAVIDFTGDSIKKAGDFQANMLEFQSVAGKEVDTKGLEKFHDLFIQIGKELPVSTSEVQQAAIEMVKGGIDPATIAAGGLRQNIQFAAAAMGGDLVKAAEISSKIMGGWAGVGASAADKAAFLTHATDLLAKAANASSTDVEGLSLGIFNAQGIARTAGVSFDDLTTTLAALAPRFASSSEAGNSLKNMIARLQPTTDPATMAMRGLGLYTEEAGSAFYDAQGNFVGFEQAAQLLQDSLKGLTKEQQAATLQQIFGNDAMGSAAALAELGATGYQNMAAALENANGVAASAALKQQGFNTALDNAKGSVEALQITLGEKLLPILTDLLNNVIAPAINAFTDWSSAILSADDPLQELVKQIDTFSPILGTVVAAIGDFITSGGDLGVVADDLNEGMDGLGDALLMVVDVAGAVVGGVQAIVAWFGTASNESSDLGKSIGDLNGIWTLALKVIQDAGAGYLQVAQAVLPVIQKLWQDHGNDISAFVKTTYDTVIAIIRTSLQLYDAIVPPMLNAIAGFFRDHGSEIEKILTGAGQSIGAIITGALETLKSVVKLGLDVVHGDWDAAWKDITHITEVQGTAIGGVVTGFLNMIAGLFDTSLAEIGALWQHNWDAMVEIASKVADRMVQVGADIIDGIIRGVESGVGALRSAVENAAQSALDAAKSALGISSPSTEFFALGEWSGQGYLLGFESMLPQIMQSLDNFGTSVTSKVQSIADGIQSAIASGFSSEATIDRQIAKNLDSLAAIQDDFQRQYVTGALKQAQEVAAGFADPKQGAAYFKMQSDQLFELAKLKQQYADAETEADKQRIANKMNLILKAQQAEQNAAAAQKPTSPIDALQQQYNDLRALLDKIESNPKDPFHAALAALGDPLIGLYNLLVQLSGAAGRAGGGSVSAGTPYWVGEHGVPELFVPRSSGMIMPPASPGQIMQGGNTSYSTTTNLSMPIYTNQSPSVLQSSLAIAGAALP